MKKLSIEPIPAIDLIEGKCVRLSQGDYATSRVYAEDPLEMAQQFEDLGFTRLHLVDLDGAKSKHVVNDAVLRRITQHTRLVVDFGGGVKSTDDLHRVMDAGATLVTCGSIAVTEPDKVFAWLDELGPDHLILGADVKDEQISINGWKEGSSKQLFPFLDEYLRAGIKHVLCTDISKDGMLQGPSTELYKRIMETFPQCRLIASGGISQLDDFIQLEQVGVPAVVFGKAIYEGKVDMKLLSSLIQ